MADMIGLAASAAGGGLFGLAGTLIGRAAGLVERRQDHAHERARWAHEAGLAAMQQQAAAEAGAAALRLSESDGQWRGLARSLEAEAAIGESYAWVNAVRALTRPVLTLLLWLITGLIYLGAAAEARGTIVETATFAATAATLWWFGDRGLRREMR